MFGKVNIGLTDRVVNMTMKWSHTFTPDIARLEKYQRQLLFICDDWMSDRVNSHVLTREDDYQRHGVA